MKVQELRFKGGPSIETELLQKFITKITPISLNYHKLLTISSFHCKSILKPVQFLEHWQEYTFNVTGVI